MALRNAAMASTAAVRYMNMPFPKYQADVSKVTGTEFSTPTKKKSHDERQYPGAEHDDNDRSVDQHIDEDVRRKDLSLKCPDGEQ